MKTFTIRYKIRFVSGTLEGLESDQAITYPLSSLCQVTVEFAEDVVHGRVIKGYGGSDYVILSYYVDYRG